MIIKLNLLQLKTKDQYKRALTRLSQKSLRLNGFYIKIFPEDFEHAFYEYLEGGEYKGRFSHKRARRLPVIEQIIKGEIPVQYILQTNRKTHTLAIICDIAECCLILLPISTYGQKYFKFVTLITFGKGTESKSKKIHDSGKKISKRSLSKVFPKEKES